MNKTALAAALKKLIDTRRDAFVIDALTLGLPSEEDRGRNRMTLGTESLVEIPSRTVSAASLRLVYDWATSDWPITLESYLSGMFHGKEWDGETSAHMLIPEVQSRITADSLGLGHLYPPNPEGT